MSEHSVHEDQQIQEHIAGEPRAEELAQLHELDADATRKIVNAYWDETYHRIKDRDASASIATEMYPAWERTEEARFDHEERRQRTMEELLQVMDDPEWQKQNKEKFNESENDQIDGLRRWIDGKIAVPADEPETPTTDTNVEHDDIADVPAETGEAVANAAATEKVAGSHEPQQPKRFERLRSFVRRAGTAALTLAVAAGPAAKGPVDHEDGKTVAPAPTTQAIEYSAAQTYMLPIDMKYAEHFAKSPEATQRTVKGELQYQGVLGLVDAEEAQGNKVESITTWGEASDDDRSGHDPGAEQPGFDKRSAENVELATVRNHSVDDSLAYDLPAHSQADVPVISLGGSEADDPAMAQAITEAAAEAGVTPDELVIRANDGDPKLSPEAAAEAGALNEHRIVMAAVKVLKKAENPQEQAPVMGQAKHDLLKAVENPNASLQAKAAKGDFYAPVMKANARGLGFTGGSNHKQPRPFNYNRGNGRQGRNHGGSRGGKYPSSRGRR